MTKTNKVEQWMPFYIADYLADTTRLTTEQHGAYFLLILDYWRNGPPPDRDSTLAQIVKLTPAKWRAMRPELVEKFQIKNGRWFHKRVERELGKAREMQTTLSERGKAGAAARWGNEGGGDGGSGGPSDASGNATGNDRSNATGMQQAMAERMPKTMLADAPSPSPTPFTPTASPSPSPPPAAPTRAGVIALLLRNQAKAKGKTFRSGSLDKLIVAWSEKGVTDEQLTAALDMAIQDREDKADSSALNSGFIDVFLAKILNPKPATTRLNGHTKQWHETSDGILAKAKELGIEPAPKHPDIDSTDRIDYYGTKLRVIRRIGMGPWVDKRNELEMRMVDGFEKAQ